MSSGDKLEEQVAVTTDSVSTDSVTTEAEKSNNETAGDTKGRPVVIDFFATWCGPCKMMAPAMEKMEKKYSDKIEFRKVDIDEERELAEQYRIEAVPTLVILSPSGEVLNTIMGAQSEEALDKIFSAL